MPYMPEGFEMQPLRSLVHLLNDRDDDEPKYDAKADAAQRRVKVAELYEQGLSDSQVAAAMNITIHGARMIKSIIKKASDAVL